VNLLKRILKNTGVLGVRFGTDRSFAYTTSFGDAVLKNCRPFVFSSHSPQEICDIINHP